MTTVTRPFAAWRVADRPDAVPAPGPPRPRADEVPPADDVPGVAEPADLGHRVVTLVAAIGLFGPAFAMWSGIVPLPEAGVMSVALTISAFVAAVGAATARTERSLRRVDLLLLVFGAAALVAWAATVVNLNPAYGTDEAAFAQYAARLLLNGHDPYGANLLPALRIFAVPIQYATYTLSGGVVHTLGYPALPVLLTVPFVELTHGVQSVIVADVAALVSSLVLAWFLLPARWRAMAVVTVVGLPILFGYAVAGINVILALPMLMVVAWRWTEVGSSGRLGRRGVVQALALGLAASVQQVVWFAVPFVVVGLWLCRRRHMDRHSAATVVGRYVALAAAAFAAVNGPFVVAGFGRWFHGVLGPLIQHAIPYGQGLIDLPGFAGVGGGNLSLYTAGALFVLVGLLAAFAVCFDRLWRAAFVLPSVALFFPTRSLAEYWMTLISVWLVSIATTELPAAPATTGSTGPVPWVLRRLRWPAGGGPGRRLPPARSRGGRPPRWILAALAFVPAAAVLGDAMATPSPLTLQITSVTTNGQFERVWRLAVEVHNRGGAPLSPHFATNSIGQMTPFWHQVAGPAAIGPHGRARYVLVAPNVGSMPGITTPFQLDAVTASPQTVSVARNFVTDPYSAWIYQSDVNRVLRKGASTTLTVQLRSPLGSAVHRAHVRVDLGQVIYGQGALIPSEAQINGAQVGQTPVSALTNRDGEATFVVRDDFPQGQPIYFQAWAVSPRGYPFGYSEVVSVLW